MFIEQKHLFHLRRIVRHGREIARCQRLVTGVLLCTAASLAVEAAPSGGVVTSGSASVTLGTDTTINQTSRRVDIDWTGFDTSAAESVTFNQPDSQALAVNRISGNRTQFDGTLNANGRIFLINRNGITFGSTAQVNAVSLLATTSELVASDPAHATHRFDGDGYGSVINEGDIIVSDGGFAVLAAPHVGNSGYIQADLGQIELASTNDFTLSVDLRGDGLITFSTAGEWLEEETGSPGVTSTGTLRSRSGHVYLSANMASEIVEGVVNLSGVVDADQFVGTPDGGTAMVAAAGAAGDYPGGSIQVESTGDIHIGGGAELHAIGGETVTAAFRADRHITMGTVGDPASITLKAISTARDTREGQSRAHAVASLDMIAARQGGTGNLAIADGVIEVTADASAATGIPTMVDESIATQVHDGSGGGTTAAATVVLEGAEVDIHADFGVHARAVKTDTGDGTGGSGSDRTRALAVLDVIANGGTGLDSSGNVLEYGAPGNLALAGDIQVSAISTTINSATSRATANVLLAASGSTGVTGDIDVDAVAVSTPRQYASGYHGEDTADANAALVMLGGAPPGLLDLLREVSLNRIDQLGTLSDILTLASLDDVLAVFGSLVDDPAVFLDRLGGIGGGSVRYRGDSDVNALADFGATGAVRGRSSGPAEATAAGYFVAGGDVYINTDPVRIDAQAYASYDDHYPLPSEFNGDYLDTEARSFLVLAAGLGDLPGNDADDAVYSSLTVLGDLSARAQEQVSLNGVPDPASYNRLAAAVTALLASGDITVRGADPLADAAPASVQGRTSRWQLCYQDQCTPVNAGMDGLLDLAAASAGDGGVPDSAHLAQLIFESLHGEIDIQPKDVTDIRPAGLYTDPVGPIWPGDLPLRFAADGRMLVATGSDATRPAQIVALDSGIEAAILAGGDPAILLPPAAAGGCIAAGRDAFTVSSPDYFDRMISVSCESKD